MARNRLALAALGALLIQATPVWAHGVHVPKAQQEMEDKNKEMPAGEGAQSKPEAPR